MLEELQRSRLHYTLLDIVIFLDFQEDKSTNVFRQYGQLALEMLSRTWIGELRGSNPEEERKLVDQYVYLAIDYVLKLINEHPHDWTYWDMILSFGKNENLGNGVHYLTQKLSYQSPVDRFIAALFILTAIDPHHQKALETLVETLEHQVHQGMASYYLWAIHGYKDYDAPTVDDVISQCYFITFWRQMPTAYARRLLAALKTFLKDTYRPDLREAAESQWLAHICTHLLAGLVLHHPELSAECHDIEDLLLEMLEESYSVTREPLHSPCLAIKAIGGNAAKKTVHLILRLLSKPENRFSIELIGALGDLGPYAKEAVPILLKLFHEATDWDIKLHILISLQEITGIPIIQKPKFD